MVDDIPAPPIRLIATVFVLAGVAIVALGAVSVRMLDKPRPRPPFLLPIPVIVQTSTPATDVAAVPEPVLVKAAEPHHRRSAAASTRPVKESPTLSRKLDACHGDPLCGLEIR